MASTEAPTAERAAAEPGARGRVRARLWLAGVLGLVGMAAVVLWSVATYRALDAVAAGFARADIPGVVTVQAHPDPYYVYAEGTDGTAPPQVTVRVTGPDGRAVPVTRTSQIAVPYDHDGSLGNAVGRFEVPVGGMGDYRIAVSGPSAGSFAVSETDLAGWTQVQRWGLAVLWAVVVGSVVVLVAGARDRRRERAHRLSLLTLLIGLPAAAVAGFAWSMLAVPLTSREGARVEGWRAVVYDLPSSLLVVGVVATGLVLAARALRAGERGANWGFWLSSVALLLVLLLFGTNTADTLTTPHSAALNWGVRGAAVLVAAAATLLARWWARSRPA